MLIHLILELYYTTTDPQQFSHSVGLLNSSPFVLDLNEESNGVQKESQNYLSSPCQGCATNTQTTTDIVFQTPGPSHIAPRDEITRCGEPPHSDILYIYIYTCYKYLFIC